ncbi:hypothetical protein HQ545_05175 [Candidatus Woesearchaeota archaeon]|nr:hypothetical protein [Candidatus Woesearchaeota archaeon]
MRYILLVLCLVLLSGCVAHTTVKEINADTEKYLGKKVVVEGKVLALIEAGMNSGFMLKSDSSSIMVSSENLPEKGQIVTVQGIVVRGMFTQHFIFAEKIR